MQGSEPDPRSREEARLALEDEIAEAQAAVNAGQARLVGLISEHLQHEYWGDHVGIRSATGYLTWKLGQTPSEAARLLEVASKLGSFPKLKASFEAGSLSLAQLKILVSIAEPETEELLLHYGLHLSGAQLARFAGHYRRAITLQEDTAHRDRRLTSGHRDDGSWAMSLCNASEHGEIIEAALRQALSEMYEEGIELDEDALDPWGARRADALLKIAESYLSSAPRKPHERHTVVVHAELETLLGKDGLGKIEGGGVVSGGTIERLLGDGASIIEMIEHGGNIIHVDKKRRLPNTALKRALKARDKCCVIPGCNRVAHRQSHHVIPYRDLEETTRDGTVLACPPHHKDLDAGRITIERTEAGLVFRDDRGRVIERPLLTAVKDLSERNRERGVEVDSQTCLPGWGGEPGSMVYCADLVIRERNRGLRDSGVLRPEDDLEAGPDP